MKLGFKEYHIQRLNKLAEHLIKESDEIFYTDPQSIIFYDQKMYSTVSYEVYYFFWAFKDMPLLFKEWKMRNGVPHHELFGRDFGTAHSAMFFFNLNEPEHFLHLFSVIMQTPAKYGGKVLTVDATGEDVGHQILEFNQKIKSWK